LARIAPIRLRCGDPLYLNDNLMMEKKDFTTWMCLICGFIYDEAAGLSEEGIPAGTRWEDIPMNWTCPECGARKEDFEMIKL
jgi:rubredoxin